MRLFFSILTVFLTSSGAWGQNASPWEITQPSWEAHHEEAFGHFIRRLGEAVENRQCNKVDECLRSTANPYFNSDPVGLKYYADCADLPYYLRGYFAWKNGLPFSIISEVKPHPQPETDPLAPVDLRYSKLGNYPVKRFDIITKKGFLKDTPIDAIKVLNDIIPGLTFSATYRMLGDQDPSENPNLFTDFYPVKINRQAIRPGTVIYDPNGHVAIIYKVTDDGRIFYIDSHPDNSLTMGMFTPKFSRSTPSQGAGFKNFRPLRLENAQRNRHGNLAGGEIVALKNSELAHFGTEQFYGNHPDPGGSWSKGRFSFNGVGRANFFEYVRAALSLTNSQIDPLRDLGQLLDDICISLKDRVEAVEAARTSGIYQQPHPERLPLNIFGTTGDWEKFATPSRDARLKVAFMDLLSQTKMYLNQHSKNDPLLRYTGNNLALDLYAVYANKAQACQFSYISTSGREVRLNLEAARQRLFKMSFDPYHCIEKRWGARLPQEIESCNDDEVKSAWYEKQQWLRNQFERTYDARMDYSLEELNGPLPGAGIPNPPDIDIVKFLRTQK